MVDTDDPAAAAVAGAGSGVVMGTASMAVDGSDGMDMDMGISPPVIGRLPAPRDSGRGSENGREKDRTPLENGAREPPPPPAPAVGAVAVVPVPNMDKDICKGTGRDMGMGTDMDIGYGNDGTDTDIGIGTGMDMDMGMGRGMDIGGGGGSTGAVDPAVPFLVGGCNNDGGWSWSVAVAGVMEEEETAEEEDAVGLIAEPSAWVPFILPVTMLLWAVRLLLLYLLAL